MKYHKFITDISSSDKVKNLGVIFDSFMNLEPQFTQACRVAYMHLNNVRKIRNMLTDEAASQLIHAFITFRIDYCNFILYGMPDTIISDLLHSKHSRTDFNRVVLVIVSLNNSIGYQLDNESLIKFLTFKAYLKTAPQYIVIYLFQENIIGLLDQIISLH